MAEEQKKEEKNSVPENAATGYGLEDHEATQQDPRVNELRRAESQHANKSQSAVASRKNSEPRATLMPTPTGSKKTPPDTPSNAATEYGLEDHKANTNDARVNQIRQPKRQTVSQAQVQSQSQSQANNEEPQPTAISRLRSSLRRVSTSPTPPSAPPSNKTPETESTTLDSDSTTVEPQAQPKSQPQPQPKSEPQQPVPIVVTPPPPPPPPPTTAAPVDGDAPQERQKRSPGVNKFTNTDVSFDPSKEFASKTTNTAGQMYSEEEDSVPVAPPPKPPQSTALNLDDIFVFAVELVKRAGAFALVANKAKERLSYTTKEHEHDLSTRTDNEVEDMLVHEINEKYPTHKIIAEEAVSRSETGQVTLTDEPTWIIDPIDGTMNFVHHFPYYCISVAFLVKKDTAFGIVYNPPLQELYTARRGKGAKLNDEPMATSGQDNLKNAMILQEYSSGMNETRTTVAMENANRLIKKTHALRSIGSSAMGLAMVASGVADGFYFFGLHVWDMAAGNLLVTEAGGSVMDPAGDEVDIMSRRVLAAATQTLAFQLSAELTQNYPKPRDDEPRSAAPVPEANKKDFNAQTEFSDSTLSLSSSETSVNKAKN